jgi:hypothetical protein
LHPRQHDIHDRSMERFIMFCEKFANYPLLQNDLSLLDKPAITGEYPPLRDPQPHAAARRLHRICWETALTRTFRASTTAI